MQTPGPYHHRQCSFMTSRTAVSRTLAATSICLTWVVAADHKLIPKFWTDMETDSLRTCHWSHSTSESSKKLNSPPKITSSLWSEDQDLSEINLSPFTNTSDLTEESEYDACSSLPVPFSKAQDIWNLQTNPSTDLDTGQLGFRNPWDPLTSSNQNCNLTDFLGSSSPNSSRNLGYVEESIYRKNETKEDIFSTYTTILGNNNQYNVLEENRDPSNLQKQLLPPLEGPPSNLWDIGTKVPFGSPNQSAVAGTDSYGLSGSSLSWDQISPSQRPVLRDIGNLNQSLPSNSQKMENPIPIKTPSEFSFQRSLQYNIPSHNSHCSQEANSAFQPQKQHTDLIALMQELSVLNDTRDTSPMPYSGGLLSPSHSQMLPSTSPVSLPSKGCVFCKNNNYHSTFYKSHVLKDERGHCQCPVLRMYVCPLCNATGDSAHTLKYCPRNTVTRGDPISAGLPPGKVTNWREVANRMMSRYRSSN